MKISLLPAFGIVLILSIFTLPACNKLEEIVAGEAEHAEGHSEGEHHGAHKILATSPVLKDVISTQQYVCQIHSCRHIEVRSLEGGYLEQILVNEGQAVRQGDLIFKILPTLYQARLESDIAEAQVAQIELQNSQRLLELKQVAQPEVALAQAKLAKAQANVNLAQAELAFANIKAPFDGIVDRQYQQLGSLIEEGDVLSTLSDNSVMWLYFNVPEARYLEYQESPKDELKVELMLANGQKFQQEGVIGAIEAEFNNENGNIAFRADFPNPNRLLRHGQTGTVLLSHVVKDALVIPQRATFEILAKKYALVLSDASEEAANEAPPHAHEPQNAHQHASATTPSAEHSNSSAHGNAPEHDAQLEHGVVHQREIVIQSELDDIYLIKDGLQPNEKIVLEGIQQVRDGDKVEYEYRNPDEVLSHLKYHAE